LCILFVILLLLLLLVVLMIIIILKITIGFQQFELEPLIMYFPLVLYLPGIH